MAVRATTAAELGKAIKEQQNEIEIEGDIKNHIVRIRAVGKVAWVIAVGAIAVAITAIIATAGSGGTSSPLSVPATGVAYLLAAGTLGGVSTVAAAIGIGVAAGGVGALTTLRRGYKLVQDAGQTKLIKK
jgi:hypothetical protein